MFPSLENLFLAKDTKELFSLRRLRVLRATPSFNRIAAAFAFH
jgi:hypothetical protein